MPLTATAAPRPAWQPAHAAALKSDVDALRNAATWMRLTGCAAHAPLLLHRISNLHNELCLARAAKEITPQAFMSLADRLDIVRNNVDMVATIAGDMPERPVQWTESTLKRVENSEVVQIPRARISTTGNRSQSTGSSDASSSEFTVLHHDDQRSLATGSSGVISSEFSFLHPSDHADSDAETDTASIAGAGVSCNWSDGESDAPPVKLAVKATAAVDIGSGVSTCGDSEIVACIPTSELTQHGPPAVPNLSPGDAAPAVKTRWADLPRRVVATLKSWLQRVVQHIAPPAHGGSRPARLNSKHLPPLPTIEERRQATFTDFWKGLLDAEGLALAVQVSAENQLMIEGGLFDQAQSLALQLDLYEAAKDQAPATAMPLQASILDTQIAILVARMAALRSEAIAP